MLAATSPTDDGGLAGVLAPSRPDSATVARAMADVRAMLSQPRATTEDLLAAASESIGAGRLLLLSSRPDVCGAAVEVVSSSGDPSPEALAPGVLEETMLRAERGAGRAALKRLAVALGLPTASVSAGFCVSGDRHEILLAIWEDDQWLDAAAMNELAEAVATAREAASRLRGLATRVERERTALAEHLHDDLIQTLTGAVLEMESLHALVEDDPDEAVATLDEYRREMRRVVADVRAVVARLAEGEPGVEGDDDAVEPERLDAYVERVVKRWGLPARVSIEGDLDRVPAPVVSIAYSVIGEALTNAAKHASTEDVTVRLSASATDLTVSICDRGRGFTTDEHDSAVSANHVGLALLQRRVRNMGGKLYVESKPGHGTRVVARLPIDEVAS
ncbi:MAG TPA: ATP-binding protein [Actinomycetota bacterium]